MNTRIIHVSIVSENGKRHPRATHAIRRMIERVVLSAVPGFLYLMKNPNATATKMKSVDVHATCEFEWLMASEAAADTPKLFATMSEKAATTRIEKKYTKRKQQKNKIVKCGGR